MITRSWKSAQYSTASLVEDEAQNASSTRYISGPHTRYLVCPTFESFVWVHGENTIVVQLTSECQWCCFCQIRGKSLLGWFLGSEASASTPHIPSLIWLQILNKKVSTTANFSMHPMNFTVVGFDRSLVYGRLGGDVVSVSFACILNILNQITLTVSVQDCTSEKKKKVSGLSYTTLDKIFSLQTLNSPLLLPLRLGN